MNISIYMNDGSEVSSIDIQDATSEEALSAIRAFGFGENEEKEEWIYSDNQKIRYKVEDSYKIRIKELTENYEKLKKTDEILRIHCNYYKTRYKEFLEQLDAVEKDRVEWKEKYETLQKEKDEVIEDRDKIFNELMELKDSYKDRVNELLDMKFKLQSEYEHNDEIKMTYDALAKDFYDLVKEYEKLLKDSNTFAKDRDAWKEMYKLECQRNEEIKTTKDFNSLVIKFGEGNYHLDELMAENDNLKKENDQLKAQYKSCLENNDILEDAVNEWKEKYAIECQHNEEIKMANDVLTKNFKALMDNRDEWIDASNMFEKACKSSSKRCLELIKERDNLKAENEKIKALCDMTQTANDILIKNRDDLIAEVEKMTNAKTKENNNETE